MIDLEQRAREIVGRLNTEGGSSKRIEQEVAWTLGILRSVTAEERARTKTALEMAVAGINRALNSLITREEFQEMLGDHSKEERT